MATLPIVVVQPSEQRLGAVARSGIGAAVGPLAQQGLDEALGLAIGARSVRARPAVMHASAAAEAGKAIRDISRAVIRHHPADADAVPPEPRPSAPQELRRRGPALIRQHFDVGQTGGIV